MAAIDHLSPDQFHYEQLSLDFGHQERRPHFNPQHLRPPRSARLQQTWRRVDSANAGGTGWSIYAPRASST